jgi:RNA polymerase sigma-70 factor, ECF subfamily
MSTMIAFRQPTAATLPTPEQEGDRHTRAGTLAPAARDQSFEEGLLTHLPALQRAALRLTRHPQEAEDLVQETLARALTYHGQFHPGTNLRAWLLPIERSLFLSACRRAPPAPAPER